MRKTRVEPRFYGIPPSTLTLEQWHLLTWNCRPGLFVINRRSTCSWCGGTMFPGENGAYIHYPDGEGRGAPGHYDCLTIIYRSDCDA